MKTIGQRIGVLFVLLATAGVWSCTEPFDLGPLLLTRFTDKAGDVAHSYHYRDQRLFMHRMMKAASSEITKWSKFYYDGDNLTTIISDSTDASSLRTFVTMNGGLVSADTTILFSSNDTTGVASRVFQYADSKLASIISNHYGADTVTRMFTYGWTGDNITAVSQSLLVDGAWAHELTLTLEYDTKPSPFREDWLYLYTLPEIDYYRLSANNHVRVVSSAAEPLVFTYSYNRFDLPAKYTSATGTEYLFVYSEQR